MDQEAKRAALMILQEPSSSIVRSRENCSTCGKDLEETPCYACWKTFGTEAIRCSCDNPEKICCWYHGSKYILTFSAKEQEKLKQMGIREKEGSWLL